MAYRNMLLAALALGVSVAASAGDESVAQKAHDLGMKGVEAVEKGASTAEAAVVKGMQKADEKVFKPADQWIQSKVNPKGTASAPKPQGPAASSP